jgi:hypothetical protein
MFNPARQIRACAAKPLPCGIEWCAVLAYLSDRAEVQTPRCRQGNSMTTFDDRQQAFEAKFAHDNDLRFRILARRGKLIGLWAAEKLGKTGEVAEEYAKSVLLSDLEIPGDDDIIAKLLADLAPLGVGMNDIKSMLAEKLAQAEAQVAGDA